MHCVPINQLIHKTNCNIFFYHFQNTNFTFVCCFTFAVHKSVIRHKFSTLGKQLCSSAALSWYCFWSGIVIVFLWDRILWLDIPSNSKPTSLTNTVCSSNFHLVVTHVVTDAWFVGGGACVKCKFCPSRVCSAPHFHLFCWTNSTQKFLTPVVVITFFCCLCRYCKM